MRSAIFINYLNYKGDSSAVHYWLPRLRKRLDKRLIDSEGASYGWDFHIIEERNHEIIYWILYQRYQTMYQRVLASILWPPEGHSGRNRTRNADRCALFEVQAA